MFKAILGASVGFVGALAMLRVGLRDLYREDGNLKRLEEATRLGIAKSDRRRSNAAGASRDGSALNDFYRQMNGQSKYL